MNTNNTYNTLKQHNGKKYSGMRIGGTHNWDYLNALWDEQKVAADRWHVRLTSTKKRKVPAPENSGVPTGTQYRWFIIAEQHVEKIDANSYTTVLEGDKFKLGHKRPYWKKMSYEYPEQKSKQQQLIHFLEKKLSELKKVT